MHRILQVSPSYNPTDIGHPLRRGTYYHQVSDLQGVCTIWREVIDASPIIWALLDPSALSVTECLSQSKDAPLTVLLKQGGPVGQVTLKDWKRIFAAIPRWETADIDFWQAGEEKLDACVSALGATPAPSLRSLFLRGLKASTVTNAFQGSTSSLRELKLDSFSLADWTLGWLAGLTTLYLINTPRHEQSFQQLHNMIAACSSLKSLHLSNIIIETTELHRLTNIINLPHLSKLRIVCTSSTTSEHLLRVIRAPICQEFVTDWNRLHGSDYHAVYIDFVKPAFHTFLRTAGSVIVQLRPDALHIQARSPDWTANLFDIKLKNSPLPDTWMACVLPLLANSVNVLTADH